MGDTHKSYKEYHDLRGDGRIVLYMRESHTKRPKFNVRLKLPNTKGYIIKSTGSPDFEESKTFGINLYYELEGKLHRGEVLHKKTFKQVISTWKNELKIMSVNTGRRYTEERIRICEVHLEPFFNDYNLDEIDDDVVYEYFSQKLQSNRNYSSQTIRHHGTVLGTIFKYLRRKKYIQDIPIIPLPKLKINPRPDFTLDEWRTLYTFMRKWVYKIPNSRITRQRFYTQQSILILGNTGMRIGELRNIKWEDIERVKDNHGTDLISVFVKGKTGSRYVIGNKGTETYFQNIFDWRKKELGMSPDKKEYVFINDLTKKPIGSFKRSFRTLLEESNLLYNRDNQPRVIYSLRHMYVTMRLTEGVNIYQLSNNIGSSVEMIERFYGKKRTKDPSNVSEITKSKTKSNSNTENNYPWNS